MEGYNNNYSRQHSGRSAAGGTEPEHATSSMKKYGHVAQSRSVQRSHALPRSGSRPKSRPKSRGGESRSASRGKMNSPPGSAAVSDEANNNRSLKRRESLKRCSSWNMIRDGKIDERGRCRRHPNIELCRREATNNSNAPWRMLLQDCPLCSLHDSGLNCNNDYNEMIRKDSITLSGDATAQTGETAATSPSSGEETSVDSDTSNHNDNIHKREKNIGPPADTTKQQQQQPVPPPQRKRSSVQTLKALGKMHLDADDAASIGARSIASRRSRHPPPPPPAGRNPYSTSNPNSSPSKKGSNASISSLSTKELSRLRKERYSSEGNNERIAELKQQHNSTTLRRNDKNLQQWRIIDDRKTRSAGNRSCTIQADI